MSFSHPFLKFPVTNEIMKWKHYEGNLFYLDTKGEKYTDKELGNIRKHLSNILETIFNIPQSENIFYALKIEINGKEINTLILKDHPKILLTEEERAFQRWEEKMNELSKSRNSPFF